MELASTLHKVIKDNGDRFCLENNISEEQRRSSRGYSAESDMTHGRSSSLFTHGIGAVGPPEMSTEGPTRSSNSMRPGFTYTMSSNGVVTQHAQPSSSFISNINLAQQEAPLEYNTSSHTTSSLLDDRSDF